MQACENYTPPPPPTYGNYTPPPTYGNYALASENYTPSPTYGNYAPAPAYAPPDDQLDVQIGRVCAIIFLFLVLVDAWNARKRRAYWFPGGLLVLSALTIELIKHLDNAHVYGDQVRMDEYWLKVQLVADGGRLAACVFIAYLLPGMVSSSFREVLGNIGALALSVLLDMFIDYIKLMFKRSPLSEIRWFELSSTILSASLILLVLLCICAVCVGKSIRYIMDQKVPLVVSCCDPNSPRKCKNIEEHVLKCWIVVRSCQPDYIMARSVFSSLAGLVVTVCVVSITFKWVCIDHHPHENLERLKHSSSFIIQFVFILGGWIVVSLRWLTAVRFFPRDGWGWIFQREDFWTRSISEWKDGLGRSFLKKRKQRNVMDLMIAFRLHYVLLAICFCLQMLMVILVFLSKASWFISQTLFCPLVTICIYRRRNLPTAQFDKYKEALEIIRMPGEKADSLWIANESAFKQTEKHFEQGRNSTRTSNKELLELVKKWSAADETAETLMAEEKMYFKYVEKKSWKMTAVSLIRFMLCLYDGTNFEMVDDAMKACSQAWDLMDFVHISDREADVVSRRADIEFCTLHDIWKQHLHMKPAESNAVRKIRNKLDRDVQSKLRKIKESQVTVDKMHDSMNWSKAAVNISLYKTWVAIRTSNTVENIRGLLGNVIVNCLTKGLKKVVVEECSKWAENGMEAEIYDAAFIAGKAFLLLDEIDGGNDGSHSGDFRGSDDTIVVDVGEEENTVDVIIH